MATGTTEFIDVTNADVFLEEVWAKEATIAREQRLVFATNVDRRFEAQLRRGQVIRIQEISNLAARAKSANTAISYETVTETEATITVDEYYYAAFAVEDIIAIQSSHDLRSRYSPKLGYALALQEDDALAALIDDGTITQTVGTMAADLSYDNLVRADQYLNDASVPEEDRVIIISPAQKAGFLKLDQFIHSDYADTRQGILGSWMGQYPIFVTPNVDGTNAAGHDNVMMHREAIAHISQMEPTVKSDYDIDYLADKVVAAELYDHAVIRADHAVWMKGA
ncbi:MAG: phage capsid protein [Dehalococcoidia bacterium]